MQKKLLTFTATALSISMLAGCGAAAGNKESGAGQAKSENKEITVLYLDEPFWKAQNEEFTKATGIKVKYETVPFTQLHDKVVTSFTGGSSDYDVIHVRDDWATEFASKGIIDSLDKNITDDMKKRLNPQSLEAMSYKGQTYAVPRYVWLWQFYYNKKLLQDAGYNEAPKTWDELIEMSKKIGKDKVSAYAESWGTKYSYSSFIVHMRANGGEFWNYQTDRPSFNTPEGLAALQLMVDMNLKHKIMSPMSKEFNGSSPMAEVFTQGAVAMNMNTPQTYPLSNDREKSRIVDQVGVALIPGGKVKTASYGESGGLAIPASSKKKELAWEYIKFVSSMDQQKKMALATGKIPTDSEALTDKEVQSKYPHFSIIPEQVKYPFGLFRHEKATLITDELSQHLLAAVLGKVTAEQALKDAEQKILQILSK
ncbi:ABC transporter substrate-binding protein [Paenibacillus radicis (ex Xue et al. 2023)]|uniref:Sugar ABC transporter substrate-binding protein n=1 Tax=Paenibacillus radicis (ex Xue et al. 2023) TaxID=2972489 RepID=A0ABT1YKZ7_9BACL|nr:sugar ABC transporter substrate-binding protein [Paenibacillus radicis (ex Xue et al. 2023)]MCR8632640.1 sugar ABC transporter substrate-binding protein [Paenibacillus radicis (ex Xue et al. 2023)]